MQLLEIPEQTPSSEIDEEIIEIFIEEVNEVFEEIVSNVAIWKNDPEDSVSLKNLRRSFHTLKGSGRLVGATVIGELGWRFENMLNKIINGILSNHPDILILLEQVEKVLPSLVEQFQHSQPATHEVMLLISQADYLVQSNGQSLGDFESTKTASSEETTPKSEPSKVLEQLSEEETNPRLENDIEVTQVQTSNINTDEPEIGIDSLPQPSELEWQAENFPEMELENEALPDDQDLELVIENLPDLELETESLPEDDFEMELGDLPDFSLENESFPESELEMGDFSFPADELELKAESTLVDEIKSDSVDFSNEKKILITNTKLITEDEDTEPIDPVLFEIFKTEATEHIDNLKESLAQIKIQSPAYVEHEMVRAFHTLNGSSRSVDFSIISEIAAPMEEYARALFERQT